jgi:hypothetical protein
LKTKLTLNYYQQESRCNLILTSVKYERESGDPSSIWRQFFTTDITWLVIKNTKNAWSYPNHKRINKLDSESFFNSRKGTFGELTFFKSTFTWYQFYRNHKRTKKPDSESFFNSRKGTFGEFVFFKSTFTWCQFWGYISMFYWKWCYRVGMSASLSFL